MPVKKHKGLAKRERAIVKTFMEHLNAEYVAHCLEHGSSKGIGLTMMDPEGWAQLLKYARGLDEYEDIQITIAYRGTPILVRK